MRTPELPRGIKLIFFAAFLLLVLPSVAASQSVVVTVPGTPKWIDTKLNVTEGQYLVIAATGTWTDGNATTGPAGSADPWPDNFFNFADLGVCNYCAQTATPHWGALIGYIGDNPPAPGSYSSVAVFPEVTKIFYVGEEYATSAPATGRLWLAKNADAYSNYTSDNRGQVEAAVSVLPPETEAQYMARAHAAASRFDAKKSLEEAANYCARASLDHWQKQAMKLVLKTELCRPYLATPPLLDLCSKQVDIAWFTGMAYQDLLKIRADFSNGQAAEATWDIGLLVYRVIGMHPGAEGQLFGLLGTPALYCTMAGLHYTGEIGGQLGQLIREKVLPPATTEAGIAGDWTLTRSAPLDCVNFKSGCQSTPIRLRVGPCSATQCTISRSDGVWQRAHTLTRQGDAWAGDFDDIAVFCTDESNVDHDNVARIGIRVTVTKAEGAQAKSVGGFYTVYAATNPPGCTGNARARWILHGSR